MTKNTVSKTPSIYDTSGSCPCSKDKEYSVCCQIFIESFKLPETAEQLMRSRYSAFVLEDVAYLIKTWHPKQCPENIEFDPNTKWLGLKVIETKSGSMNDTEGWVKFVARYKIAGKAHRIEELSYFEKIQGQWLYCYAEDSLSVDRLPVKKNA